MNYQVIKYQSANLLLWNEFVSKAKNATFLFDRNYMDYHADRFSDFSLMVFQHHKLVGILPANLVGNVLYSHQGLSYGGLVTSEKLKFKDYVTVFAAVLQFLSEQQIAKLVLRELPFFYKNGNDELSLIGFKTQSVQVSCDIYTYMPCYLPYVINRNRKREIVAAYKNNIVCTISTDYAVFWEKILGPNLKDRYQTNPVHSLAEIELLASRFPENIMLWLAYKDNEVQAGVVMFVMDKVAHFQYSAALANREETKAIDVLFHEIILHYKKEQKHISFGISNDPTTGKINNGVLYWKESYGAENTVQRKFEIPTRSFVQLNQYFI